MKNNKHLFIVITFLLAIMTLHISAAEIHLNDGRVFQGQITGITKTKINMEIESGSISINQKDVSAVISSIESNKKTEIA